MIGLIVSILGALCAGVLAVAAAVAWAVHEDGL